MVIISFIFKDNRILMRGKIGTKRQGSSGNRGINAVVDLGEGPPGGGGGGGRPHFWTKLRPKGTIKNFF